MEGLRAATSGRFDAFDSDVAVQLGIGGKVDLAHAAGTDLSFNGVAGVHGREGGLGEGIG